jgi:hypothetical protein
MNCKLVSSCPLSLGCLHKDVAEVCNYHLLNYIDQTSKEFKKQVYPNLNSIQEPIDYNKIRENNKMKNPLDPYEKD